MLEDLVSGKEKSRFILVQDSVNHRGGCILNYTTQSFLDRFDVVILFCLDNHERKLKFNNHSRLIVHDGFTNPLNWMVDKSLTSMPIKTPFYLKSTLIKIIENDEKIAQVFSEKCLRVGVVINSLSSIIAHQSIAAVCRDLYEAIHYQTQTCEVLQTVALVHADLHNANILSSLNFIAPSCIYLQTATFAEHTKLFSITHCKMSGKLIRKTEAYRIDDVNRIEIIPVKEKFIAKEKTAEKSVDIAADLTFKLSLTEQQKQTRAQLQLPYLLDNKTKKTQLDLGKKSQIFYEADEVDDLDEEDPDDDLNI